MTLSKSQYIRGLQCVKSLWLKKYKSDILSSPDQPVEDTREIGNKVGLLACELFPNGVTIPYKATSYRKKIALTQRLIKNKTKNIFEASFFNDGIFVAIDILHINNDNSIDIYEVKSSTEIKRTYLDDLSIQYYVLSNLGYKIKSTNLIHINNSYVRENQLDIKKLFIVTEVTNKIKELQNNIPIHLKKIQRFLDDRKSEPDIDIGTHCLNPYPCDAIKYCWKHIPKYSIFNISRLKYDKKFSLYYDNIIKFEDIKNISIFSQSQQIQIHSELTQKQIINEEAINEFLDTLSYPIYHLDFETFQQAIPEWKGISPFMQIPFQYSLHIEKEDGSLTHKEFLAKEGEDPRYELAKRLVTDIPTDVTVLTYNMGFEKGVIRKLATMFEELSTHLLKIHDNIKDLMTPFAKKDYYVPEMRGSYSIKYVFPALVPEMADAYQKLNGIHNGTEAMHTYAKLANLKDKTEIQRLREALLKYCELDTFAMVKV